MRERELNSGERVGQTLLWRESWVEIVGREDGDRVEECGVREGKSE